MAYDEGTAQRVRDVLAGVVESNEGKMFGGLCMMVRGHMLCGVMANQLMIRVGAEQYADSLAQPHAREMDFTGKALKGFVYVDSAGFEDDADLEAWVNRALAFNEIVPPK